MCSLLSLVKSLAVSNTCLISLVESINDWDRLAPLEAISMDTSCSRCMQVLDIFNVSLLWKQAFLTFYVN